MVSPKNIFNDDNSDLDTEQRAAVLTVLKTYEDPATGIDIIAANCLTGLIINDGHFKCVIEILDQFKDQYVNLKDSVTIELQKLPFIQNISIALTAKKPVKPEAQPLHKTVEKISLPMIKKIIAVASGKGGVGKSTLAVNIAVGLQTLGYKTGLMDADFYGPSIPMMLALNQQPQISPDKKFIPLDFNSLKCMSMGFLVQEDTPIIWRGPIVQSSFQKLLTQTLWPELDVLVIDLPPGTGDIHLTMIQKVSLDGIIIVSTPQDLALLDARRAIAMFQKLGTPILGIIENMSLFTCPHCHESIAIFDQHGVRNECTKNDIAYLGAIPLHIDIRRGGDSGKPIVLQDNQLLSGTMQGILSKISDKIFDKIV